MAKDATQLRITDGFTRAKRTLLLFSAGLLALGLATDPGAPSLDLTFFSVEIPVGTVQMMLLAAVIYYLLLFTVEWRAIVRLNNNAGVEESSIDLFVARLQERFGQVQLLIGRAGDKPFPDEMSRVGNEMLEFAQSEGATANDVADALERSLRERMPPGSPVSRTLIDGAVAQAGIHARMRRKESDKVLVQAAATLDDYSVRTDAMTAAIKAASANLDRIHVDLTRLSNSLGRERIFAFYWLEVGATYLFALLSVAVGVPPVRLILDALLAAVGLSIPTG